MADRASVVRQDWTGPLARFDALAVLLVAQLRCAPALLTSRVFVKPQGLPRALPHRSRQVCS